MLPEQKPINSTFINTWEDRRVVVEVEKTGRKQLELAGLWTEICLAMPALQAREEGYEVFAVTDASGGVSVEAHEMAVRRMVAAGIVPITWMAVASEWQRNWARSDTFRPSPRSSPRTVTAAGLPLLAWEMQLLGKGSRRA